MNPAAIILAAGFSSRMGEFKPLLPLGGRTLLEWCVSSFQVAGITNVLVVTGHRGPEVGAEAARLGARSVHNPDYVQGMFSSVQTAVRTVGNTDFFLLPVDIPLVRPATLLTLLEAEGPVVCPCFDGQRGHPPRISSKLVPEILTYSGDGGLGGFLEGRPVVEVPVWDRGVLLDADRPYDLSLLEQKAARLHMGEPAEALILARRTMPEKGVAHGLAVARVALNIGKALNLSGLELDLELMHNAALLHDIGKNQPSHEAVGAAMLRNLGLSGLAPIVAAHRDVPPPQNGQLTEMEVVCLADKLVYGSVLVSVEERFAEKLAIYAEDASACLAIENRKKNALALQKLVEKCTGRCLDEIAREET